MGEIIDLTKAQPEEPKKEAAPSKPQTEVKQLPEMTCGYVVGLQPTGDFVFEVIGSRPGIVEIAGLHKYAGVKIDDILDVGHSDATRSVLQNLKEVMELQKVILQNILDKE